jgi:protein-tyrosine phosphatase
VIDLHSHLLPGIDDGPVHLDDALAMAQMAVADGIHTSVLHRDRVEALWPGSAARP